MPRTKIMSIFIVLGFCKSDCIYLYQHAAESPYLFRCQISTFPLIQCLYHSRQILDICTHSLYFFILILLYFIIFPCNSATFCCIVSCNADTVESLLSLYTHAPSLLMACSWEGYWGNSQSLGSTLLTYVCTSVYVLKVLTASLNFTLTRPVSGSMITACEGV